ncbi:MAG TPA: hypothetical protein VGJ61_06745 [Solirubrobacterales bacterium]
MNAALPLFYAVERDQVVAAQFVAVSRDQVNLVSPVLVSHIPVGRVPTAHEMDLQHLSAQPGGLALHPIEPFSEAEDQVATRVLRKRLEDFDAELNRFERDRHLANRAAKVWIHANVCSPFKPHR